MQRLSRLTLLFAVAFAVFLIGPALLSAQFNPYPLLKTGDVFDLLTPLVLIPLYWYLFRSSANEQPSHQETVVFLILTALWIEGQGMHLAANSIGHLLDAASETDASVLTGFYDEVLSHYLWHSGVVSLSVLLMWRGWHHPLNDVNTSLWAGQLAGLIYGLTFFIIVVEAGTAPLGVTYALLTTVFGMTRGRRHLNNQPLLTFFTIGAVVSSVLFAAWAIRWGGLPEFSEVGIIE
jgi:hypothetical protein